MFISYGAGNEQDTKCWKYNAVCVGGYDANRSWGLGSLAFDDNFLNDTPAHAYRNFSGTNREQPLLVASSVDVFVSETTQNAPVGRSGTSYATPAISGLAGLAMSIFPNLRWEPTVLRAALLASAKHNIADTPVPVFGDAVDDRDGAGAPRGDRLMQLLLSWALGGPHLRGGVLDRDVDFNPNGEMVIPLAMQLGQRVRIALTWDVCPYSASVGLYDHLTIDLDLVVEGPPRSDGTPSFFKANPSIADNYEVLDFTATSSGQGKIRIQAPRWSGCADLGPSVVGSAVQASLPGTPRRTFYSLAYDITAPLE